MISFVRPKTCSSLRRLVPALIVLTMAGAGCSNVDEGIPVGPGFDTKQFAKELEVEQARYRHSVLFATDGASLNAVERQRLQGFLGTLGVQAGDVVQIEGHADERAGDLYNLELSARRLESVEEAVRAAGYREIEIVPAAFGKRVPAVPGSTPEAWRQNRRVEVIVERTLVVLPACPDWSRESGTDFANLPLSNLGCGVRTNLGLMVADPGDLVEGRQLGPADGIKAAGAVERYRAGEETELEQEVLD